MRFFELSTPTDLYRKLEADLALLEASNHDTYAAFNFFVTAEHLADWLGRRQLVRRHGILRIVSHIANGAKHFVLDPNRHTSVTRTEKFRYVEEGYVERDYVSEPLLIHLSEAEAQELRTTTIDAVVLARRVLEFWRQHLPRT